MKTILLTGVTGAIGRATALELARARHHLVLLSRNREKLEALQRKIMVETGNERSEILVADLSDPASVRAATNELKRNHKSLNALVNIAAVFTRKRQESSSGHERMLATNHLGPFLLTTELLDLLKAGQPARIITVAAPSTTKINFDALEGKEKGSFSFMQAFGSSKMMNLMFCYALARRLEGSGVTTSVFHPGLVKSELIRELPAPLKFFMNFFSGKPDRAAKMLARLATDEDYLDSNGTFYTFSGKMIRSNDYSHNTELQEKLWTLSEKLVKA